MALTSGFFSRSRSLAMQAAALFGRRPVLWPVSAAILSFAAGCLLVVPPFGTLYRFIAGPVNTDFTIASWHLNWFRNGFTKRGFPGTLTALLGLTADPRLLWITHYLGLAVAAVGIGVIAANLTRRLAPAHRALVLVFLTLSPAMLVHTSRDVGRLTPLLFLALLAGAALYANGRVLIAAVVLALAGLVHEVVLLVGGVLFGVIALDRFLHGRVFSLAEWIRNAVAAVALLALLVALSVAKPTNLEASYQSALPFVVYPNYLRAALWWYTTSIASNIGENLCYFRELRVRWIFLVIDAAFIAVHLWVLFAPLGRVRLMLAGLIALSFVPLAFVALDMGRWTALVVVALWAYFLVIVAWEDEPRLALERVPVLAVSYLLGPLSIGGTLLLPQALLLKLAGVSTQWTLASVCFPSNAAVLPLH
jgi:hypothetical protein